MRTRAAGVMVAAALVAGCPQNGPRAGAGQADVHDCTGGGLVLPRGFCAQVFAEGVGAARHLAVRDNGDVFVALQRGEHAFVALRDGDGDGVADEQARMPGVGGTGIGIHDGWLYMARDTSIVRYRLRDDALLPEADAEVVVAGFEPQASHAAKTIAFDDEGGLYTNIGAPSNACQSTPRRAGVAGLDPCPQRERHAGIWRFDAGQIGQDAYSDGVPYARGIRNALANAWHPAFGRLYAVQHGRDQLSELWPRLYSIAQNVTLPAEELLAVDAGDDFGWPYCYYDPFLRGRVLAPEYGGDGELVGRCADFEPPVAVYPAHWAPNALHFYRGEHFPDAWRHGAFIAFHGSWNRAPEPQAGFNVTFQPLREDGSDGPYRVFADGFAGTQPVRRPQDARFRPTGLAESPDGRLYIADSVQGRIWRVSWDAPPESEPSQAAP